MPATSGADKKGMTCPEILHFEHKTIRFGRFLYDISEYGEKPVFR